MSLPPPLHVDPHLIVAHKPAGLAVHRSRLVGADEEYLVDLLRERFEGPLHAVHRLDRATSGALLVARSPEIAGALGRQLMAREIHRTYLAVVRGWPAEAGELDHPLTGAGKRGPARPAVTRWRRLATATVPIALGRYPEQRYALVLVEPETGRYRQIRRHFHHLSHHVLGDTSHGRGEHNRLLREHFGVHRLLLHAWKVRFTHPVEGREIACEAPLDAEWQRLCEAFGWDPSRFAAAAGPA